MRSAFAGAKLSPDARYVAARVGAAGYNDVLVVVNLETKESKVLGSASNGNVEHFDWLNERRLVYTVESNGGTELHAVDRDGKDWTQLSDSQQLFGRPHRRPLLDWSTFRLNQCGTGKQGVMFVTDVEPGVFDEVRKVNLVRLDTHDRRLQTVKRPGPVTDWLLDEHGEPAIAMAEERGRTTVLHRSAGSQGWHPLASWAVADNLNAVQPVGFGPDGTLFVTASAGKDTMSLHAWNFKTGNIEPEPLVTMPGYDFEGGLIATCTKILGVHFVTDAASIEWLDPGMKALQQQIDKLLPATVNLVSVAARAETSWVLVLAYSDVIPDEWWLYNTKTQEISKLGTSHLPMDPSQLGRQQAVRYKARDGLEIPALLTLPPGPRTNLPMVVLVHGGPNVRADSWGWRAEPQFLASRGYAVLEPAFRGSTGLGFRHFQAGWRQWGLAMQDDLADGTRWAIAQGIADPKRVCIAGASYGGYATLMGLVNDPELYRCGIDWVGVTDIQLLFSGSWNYASDMTDRVRKYGFKKLIGDPDKDAAQFKATSPIEQAARITRPVLLAYGGLDRRVPIVHGTRLRDAVKRTNPNVEWIEYPDEGHGWWDVETSVDFWTRVERFLDKHIGKRADEQIGDSR